jgi:hypothetical protein
VVWRTRTALSKGSRPITQDSILREVQCDMRAGPTYQIEVWCPACLQHGAGLRLCLMTGMIGCSSSVTSLFAPSKACQQLLLAAGTLCKAALRRLCFGFPRNIPPPSLTLTYLIPLTKVVTLLRGITPRSKPIVKFLAAMFTVRSRLVLFMQRVGLSRGSLQCVPYFSVWLLPGAKPREQLRKKSDLRPRKSAARKSTSKNRLYLCPVQISVLQRYGIRPPEVHIPCI